jgi:N-acetylglucosamine kinase-like BadF-type ATPase
MGGDRVSRSLVVGVDGGASKTVALVADRSGRILGAGRAGNADIYRTAGAKAEVGRAIADALAAAGVAHGDLGAAALSLVGVDWPEDAEHWRRALGELDLGHLSANRVAVVNDAIGALTAGAPEGPALVIALGTGCAVGGRGADGRIWHSSFWQRTHGGVEIAEAALDAVYLAELEIGPATAMTAAALRHFGRRDVADLLHAFTARDVIRPAGVPGFAPRVLDIAGAGDRVARDLALSHADRIAAYGLAAARQVGITADDRARLVLTGGVLRHRSRLIADRLVERICATLPALHPIEDPPEPVAGAVLLALGLAGTTAGDAMRETLRRTMPPLTFFQTAGPANGEMTC